MDRARAVHSHEVVAACALAGRLISAPARRSCGPSYGNSDSLPAPGSATGTVRSVGTVSELVPGLAERAFAECENLGGSDAEDQGGPASFMLERAVSGVVVPSPVPLGRPLLGEAFQDRLFGDAERIALDDEVEAFVPAVAAGHEGDMRVVGNVDGFLFLGAGAEVQGAVEPHGYERHGTYAAARRRESW